MQLLFQTSFTSKEIITVAKDEIEIPHESTRLLESSEKEMVPHQDKFEEINLGASGEHQKKKVKIGSTLNSVQRQKSISLLTLPFKGK